MNAKQNLADKLMLLVSEDPKPDFHRLWKTLSAYQIGYIPQEGGADFQRQVEHFLLQYIWVEVWQPARLFSISCLSYNKRSNWLTNTSLGFYVRQKDCQPSSCCSVRFEQVEPPQQ